MIHADTNALQKHNPKSFRPTVIYFLINNSRLSFIFKERSMIVINTNILATTSNKRSRSIIVIDTDIH